jgi:hypothetical protein
MKALIWKEWLEHIKWVPLPGLAILLVFLIDKPMTPMPDVTQAFFYALTAIIFGAGLGFLQIFLDGQGDKRSLLLHRPLGSSGIFVAKAIAGIGMYVLALGLPFVCLELWLSTPGKMPAPYHWRTSLPWLADILSGLVFYFAGMLTAQREMRWYGSRGLPIAAAFCCTYLVWILPEFWQALVAIGIFGSILGVAAWGSFRAGGAYTPQPRLAKTALAMTFVAGLLILSMLGKQLIGQVFDSGIEYHYDLDRQGRLLFGGFKPGVGPVGSPIYLNADEAPDLKSGQKHLAPDAYLALDAFMETPIHRSYRHSGRFYASIKNDTKPDDELWYYDQNRGLLLGYDSMLHQFLGSFGPDGFSPPGQQPRKRFQGELLYRSDRWHAIHREFVALPGGVYKVDFSRRTIRTFFAPAKDETITFTDRWEDPLDHKQTAVVVSTDRSFHFLKTDGTPIISVPREFDRETHGYVYAGPLEKPDRYYVWYQTWQMLLEPEEFQTTPGSLLEYDVAGREIARRTVPPISFPAVSHANALFGLLTPMTEAASLAGATRYQRWQERSQGSTYKSVLLRSLESSIDHVPGAARYKVAPSGLIAGYLALILLSAGASAIGCFLLARRSAFSRARCIGWALCGFFLGWAGLALMFAIQEWPARIACPKCRKLRVVTRPHCEHCGAAHAQPEPDGTEIFAVEVSIPHPVLVAS